MYLGLIGRDVEDEQNTYVLKEGKMADESKVWNVAKKAISKSNPLLGAAINVAEGMYKGIKSSDIPKYDGDLDLEYIKSCLSEFKGKTKCFTDKNHDEKMFNKFAKKLNIPDSENIICIIGETTMLMTEGVIFTDRGMHVGIISSGTFFLSYKEIYQSEIENNYGMVTSKVIIIKDDIKYKIDLTEKNVAKLLYNALSHIKEYKPPVAFQPEEAEVNIEATSIKDNELGYVGMLKAFLEQGNIEQNREMLNTLAKSSNMSIERAIEIEEIIKGQSFKDNELGYVGMLKSFIEQNNIEQNRPLLATLANSSNISPDRAKEIENIIYHK